MEKSQREHEICHEVDIFQRGEFLGRKIKIKNFKAQ